MMQTIDVQVSLAALSRIMDLPDGAILVAIRESVAGVAALRIVVEGNVKFPEAKDEDEMVDPLEVHGIGDFIREAQAAAQADKDSCCDGCGCETVESG